MSDLKERLARLGLSQYHHTFSSEGFDTWDTVLDITESDLSHLNVKLGHRRKLQRAIAESRGQSSDRPLPTALVRATSAERSYRSDDSGPESKGKQADSSVPGSTGTSTKRKYRRHPKPDEHAPERPPSAYVIFSNQVRESLKGQDLSFTEIAKVVGERWQILPVEEREGCERQANGAKEKYYAELAEYKKTNQYEVYQRYLEDFRAKHAAPTKEGKRSKLETETSTSTRSSSHDQHERLVDRRFSSAQPEFLPMASQRSNPSPPIGPARLPLGPSYASKPTSPSTNVPSAFNSPRSGEPYLPMTMSPRSAAPQRDAFFETSLGPTTRSTTRGSLDSGIPFHPSAYAIDPTQHTGSSTSTPPYPSLGARYQIVTDHSPRRTIRESSRLPPLTHEDTTLSSESGHSNQSLPLGQTSVQSTPLDSLKTLRTLPQPVPSIGSSTSSMDRPGLSPSVPMTPHMQLPLDYNRTQGPLAVLLRAGELAARLGDNEPMDEGSP
ncbi:hypothetical protein ACN47E_001189 [Coniothyrium glycines]